MTFLRPRFALLAVVFAIALTGCGIPLVEPPTKVPPTSCAIADLSDSTKHARAAYVAQFTALANRIAARNGQLCLIIAAGDPTESQPMLANLAPQHPDNQLLASGERAANVHLVTQQFEQLLAHPPLAHIHSSALIESAIPAARLLRRGSELLYLTDGIQASHLANFYGSHLTEQGITATLDRLSRQGLLPDLRAVRVDFPLPLYDGRGGAGVSAQRQARIQVFWYAWARRTGATLTWGAT